MEGLADPVGDGLGEVPVLDVSFSDLATFGECGHRYRLGNVLAFQTQMAPELGYGRAIHHVQRWADGRAASRADDKRERHDHRGPAG